MFYQINMDARVPRHAVCNFEVLIRKYCDSVLACDEILTWRAEGPRDQSIEDWSSGPDKKAQSVLLKLCFVKKWYSRIKKLNLF